MDAAAGIVEAIGRARKEGQCLRVRGHSTKSAWLSPSDAIGLETSAHSGIVTYDPTELVVTVRAGTRLQDLVEELAQAGQVLAFDPPQFGSGGTVGGMVSAGFSGPTRPWNGSMRDALLGVNMVNGLGETLNFGGQVMKNVAGYDVSRLMAGACGALGVILQASIRVQPKPEVECTLGFELTAAESLEYCRSLARQYLPLAGSWWVEGQLFLRLQGSAAGVSAAQRQLGGAQMDGASLWAAVRDHRAPFFQATSHRGRTPHQADLWRLVVPPGVPLMQVPDAQVAIEWGGGQRWLWHDDADVVRAYAASHKGWAWALGQALELEPNQRRYMTQIKQAFDPHGLFDSPLGLATHAH